MDVARTDLTRMSASSIKSTVLVVLGLCIPAWIFKDEAQTAPAKT